MGAIVGKCRETEKTRSFQTGINRRGSSLRCVVNTPSNHTTLKSSAMLSETNSRGLPLKRTSLVNNNNNNINNNNDNTQTATTLTTTTTKGDLGENEMRVKKRAKPAPAPLAVPLSSCLVQSKYTANSGRNISLTYDALPPAQERKEKTTAVPHTHTPPTNNITAISSDESFDLHSDGGNGIANDGIFVSGPLPLDHHNNSSSNSNSGSGFKLPTPSPSTSAKNTTTNTNTNTNNSNSNKKKKTPLSSDAAAPRGSHSLMECSFDSGGPMRDERGRVRRSSSINSNNTNNNSVSSSSTGNNNNNNNNSSISGAGGSKTTTTTTTSVSPFLPFIAAHHADERSAKSFIDYITHHALFLRSSREVTWFNVEFNRTQLRRRTRDAMISWNPLEEIAYNDSEDSSTEAAETSTNSNSNSNSNSIPAATATTTTTSSSSTTTTTTTNKNNNNNTTTMKETQIPARGPLQQRRQKQKQEEKEKGKEKDDEMLSTVRSRVRPIISTDVPHHMQLAKKALEDNVIFIHSRSPKFF